MADKNDKILIPVEENSKGIKTITIYLNEYEIIETGITEVNGKLVNYAKYKILN